MFFFIVSKATRSGPFFAFSDVEALISSRKSEKLEGSLPSSCPKKISSKSVASDSKKRKLTIEEEDNVFEGLDIEDIKKKMISMTHHVSFSLMFSLFKL